ncbi:Assembly factor cbp-4 [Fusarium oxysporum f. sp. albedinis]|nr:Assembly factor cbp-4 [Fusarium oxysporum f. sp. albedinis]
MPPPPAGVPPCLIFLLRQRSTVQHRPTVVSLVDRKKGQSGARRTPHSRSCSPSDYNPQTISHTQFGAPSTEAISALVPLITLTTGRL